MEQEPIGFGMGWFPRWDPRNWSASPHIDYSASLPASQYWHLPRILNQLSSPSCVGHAGRHDWEASPVEVPFDVGLSALQLYAACQAVDGIPMPHDGTSLNALARVSVAQGRWTSYVWPKTLEEVIRWLLGEGPVILGSEWWSGMMSPDSRGVIRPTGSIVGGHAIAIVGYDQISGYLRLCNSWGTGWGTQRGRCWLFIRDLEFLMRGGEILAPLEPGM
jgi:hypothetical protein